MHKTRGAQAAAARGGLAVGTLAALLLAVALAGPPALAHGEAKPMHGGLVQVAADLQFELVAQPAATALYVVDHGKPADAARFSGKLTVLQGARKTEVALRHAGANKLEAPGLALAPGAKVVASITGADGKPLTVRFSLK